MTNAKIDVAMGDVKFAGEGTEAWVAAQLEKVIAAATALGAGPTKAGRQDRRDNGSNVDEAEPGEFTESLASFLKSRGAEGNANRRFLATADWLRRRGAKQLTAAMVVKALKDHHQKKLANAGQSLNRLCAAGECEKDGSNFFITPDGHKALEPKA